MLAPEPGGEMDAEPKNYYLKVPYMIISVTDPPLIYADPDPVDFPAKRIRIRIQG